MNDSRLPDVGTPWIRVAMLPGMYPGYPRNVMLATALKLAGADVIQCVTTRDSFVTQYRQLWKQLRRVDMDVLLLTYPAHRFVPLVWALSRSRNVPIVFDPLFSLLDTKLGDRQEVRPLGLRRIAMWAADRIGCRMSAFVLTDSREHADFLSDHTGIAPDRFVRIWTGTDERIMRPCDAPPESFTLHPGHGAFHAVHYGNYFPLQGTDVIIRAAERLARVGSPTMVTMIGEGPTRASARHLARAAEPDNVRFLDRVSYRSLRNHLCSADVVLGVFGTTGKASRVVPNKAFDALAVGRPLITGDTPAAREFLQDGVNALLCPVGDPEALAECIERLRRDEDLRHHLSAHGPARIVEAASAVAQSPRLASLLQVLVGGKGLGRWEGPSIGRRSKRVTLTRKIWRSSHRSGQ
jgi:glycosyltransferase involved in cell wall biosynthesis